MANWLWPCCSPRVFSISTISGNNKLWCLFEINPRSHQKQFQNVLHTDLIGSDSNKPEDPRRSPVGVKGWRSRLKQHLNPWSHHVSIFRACALFPIWQPDGLNIPDTTIWRRRLCLLVYGLSRNSSRNFKGTLCDSLWRGGLSVGYSKWCVTPDCINLCKRVPANEFTYSSIM